MVLVCGREHNTHADRERKITSPHRNVIAPWFQVGRWQMFWVNAGHLWFTSYLLLDKSTKCSLSLQFLMFFHILIFFILYWYFHIFLPHQQLLKKSPMFSFFIATFSILSLEPGVHPVSLCCTFSSPVHIWKARPWSQTLPHLLSRLFSLAPGTDRTQSSFAFNQWVLLTRVRGVRGGKVGGLSWWDTPTGSAVARHTVSINKPARLHLNHWFHRIWERQERSAANEPLLSF